MLRNIRLTLCAGAMLAAAAIAPNAALAFGLPLPLPHLGLAGLHPGLGGLPLHHFGGSLPHAGLGGPSRLGFGGPGRLSRGGFSGLGRSGVPSGMRGARYGRGDYAHGGSRHRYWGRYAGAGAGAGYGSGYGYGSTGSYGDDGCSYTYTSGGRRVRVCSDD